MTLRTRWRSARALLRLRAADAIVDEGVSRDKDLKAWLDLAVDHVSTLPTKKKATPTKKPAKSGRASK